MIEPQWGYDFMKFLVDLGHRYPRLGKFYPIGADIFVFIYPIFLVALYLSGIFKKNIIVKKGALFIFVATLFSVLFTIFSQTFFDKLRPIYDLGIVENYEETLLHSFLPSTSFPSDHAVVSFAIAMATLIVATRTKKKKLKNWAGILFLIAIIMSLCRVGTTVHWTTDILAGASIGILVPAFLGQKVIYHWIERRILEPIIRLEEWIVEKVLKYQQ